MEQLVFHWRDFHRILYLRIFGNSIEKIQVLLKFDKSYVHLWWRLDEFFLEWEMFQARIVEEIKTHILW
jgi:hypothetical protein